jgi:hypothetical protein
MRALLVGLAVILLIAFSFELTNSEVLHLLGAVVAASIAMTLTYLRYTRPPREKR